MKNRLHIMPKSLGRLLSVCKTSLWVCGIGCTSLQSLGAEQADLYKTILDLDTQLFAAFNQCGSPKHLAEYAEFFAPDVEFYHDNAGVTWTRDAMLANTKKNACGNYTRKLEGANFRVSPVKDYGAIAAGVHIFCEAKTRKCEGEADFAMVWRYENGRWQITRALSFGHRSHNQ